MVSDDDWRLPGHGGLQGVSVRWKPYRRWGETWDRDHCQFCWVEFMEADNLYRDRKTQPEGYAVAAHAYKGMRFPIDYK